MTDRPILFQPEMIQAILADRKTQTRRVIKPQPIAEFFGPIWFHPTVTDRAGENRPGPKTYGIFGSLGEWSIPCPYGAPGDRLWVRESLTVLSKGAEQVLVRYRADESVRFVSAEKLRRQGSVSSIHMPKVASRLTLRIVDIRADRLQKMTEADAVAEGFGSLTEFSEYWNRINRTPGHEWEADPYVWIISFTPVGERVHSDARSSADRTE